MQNTPKNPVDLPDVSDFANEAAARLHWAAHEMTLVYDHMCGACRGDFGEFDGYDFSIAREVILDVEHGLRDLHNQIAAQVYPRAKTGTR